MYGKMSSKKIRLQYKKERVVLSEILPYEVPLFFSNRHFYKFLVANKIEFKDNCITWNDTGKVKRIEQLVKLIFGIRQDADVRHANNIRRIQVTDYYGSIPFGYKIRHKESEFRTLSICHPINQLEIVSFYEQYKELILYYCSISQFSIRKPQRIAKFTFYKDKVHYDNKSDDGNSTVEEHRQEYENLRSFFVYKDFSNVYKFYESYKFHRCEKKYNRLLKLDISKCFDSIYTHSLSWALLGKECVKESLKSSKETFSGLFDKLMQKINYNETNGILIGSELSRIFAELILQSVDHDLLVALDNNGIHHKVDYEIFRYVDDYFIFYNEESTKEHILENLQHCLKIYKLHFNNNKQVVYEKPIITEITIAKQRVIEFISEYIIFKLEESGELKKGKIKIRSNQLITHFKTIIKECNVDYKDILNYTLSIVENKSEDVFKNYLLSDKDEEQLLNAIIEIIEFVFFIYSVSPRVNTSLRLCKILAIYFSFLKENKIKNNDSFYNSVSNNIRFVLEKNKLKENTQVETVYLLLALSELGVDYELNEETLLNYFSIKEDSGTLKSQADFNYFTIFTLIFYIKDNEKYSRLLKFIENEIKVKFNTKQSLKNTEMILLLMDSISCPFLSKSFKEDLLEIYHITDSRIQRKIINSKLQWFINWNDFNFKHELDAKRSKEVY
jgi:hypothetical protein